MSEPINRPLNIPGKRMRLTKRMIETAMENSKSNMGAAKWLNVSYNTYKKWSKYYGLFDQHLNQAGVGIKKGWATYRIPMENILSGKLKSKYTLKRIKKRLIEEGYMVEECSVCGWNEERITDGLICLGLDFLDGDSSHTTLDNMRLLCPNCYLSNNGFLHNSKVFCK